MQTSANANRPTFPLAHRLGTAALCALLPLAWVTSAHAGSSYQGRDHQGIALNGLGPR
jgi:hypothetical protein